MEVYVGTSGWSFSHWAGKFYPKGLKRAQWLEFYAKNFPTVEMNVSFYRFPSEDLVFSWKQKMPENFLVTMKANREITHKKRFKEAGDYLKDFYRSIGGFKENLGCILFQSPPTFRFSEEHFSRLQNFFENLDRKKNNVFEFRHKSWWNAKVFNFFEQQKVTFASVSGFGLPKEIINTNGIVYARFHGRIAFSSLYSEKSLQEWAQKIKKSKAEKFFCYFNNDQNANAVKNAKQLKALL